MKRNLALVSVFCVLFAYAGWGCGGGDGGTDTTAMTDMGAQDTGTMDPGVKDPGGTDTGVMDMGVMDPGNKDTGTMDPGVKDPGGTDTGAMDPGASDPGQQDTGTATTFAQVQPVFQAKCGGCHVGSSCSTGVCFGTSYSDTLKSASSCPGKKIYECIQDRVMSGSMPKGKGCKGDPAQDAGNPSCLTKAELDLLKDWVSAGGPEN